MDSAKCYATKNCGNFLSTSVCKELRETFQDWMQEKYGAVITKNAAKAPARVYPDSHGWPMLPPQVRLPVKLVERKPLIRRSFSAVSLAMGGIQPSWTRTEQRMLQDPGSVISLVRMPPNITVLQDMKTWVRSTSDAWVDHIINGQTGTIPPSKRFAYRIVPRPANEPEFIVESPDFRAKEGSQLRWSAEELLYKERMIIEDTTQPAQVPAFRNLPLARTTHIYVPYSVELFHALEILHEEDEDMRDLLTEIAKVEELGPIHMSTGMSDGPSCSPHIPFKGQPSLTARLQPAEWLPIAFFDSTSSEHKSWSMTSFHAWIRDTCPHIDTESGTVYGGPLGIRTLAFALSRVSQNAQRVLRGEDIPRPIDRVARGLNRTWSHSTVMSLVRQCIQVLRRDIAKSRGVLEKSYPERARQWEEMIRMTTEQHLQRGTALQVRTDKGPSATSGVPKNIHTILDMHEALSERDAVDDEFDAEQEASTIVAERREETLRETRETERELSTEYIDIFEAERQDPKESFTGKASTVGSTGNRGFRVDSGSESDASQRKINTSKQMSKKPTRKRKAASGKEPNVAERNVADAEPGTMLERRRSRRKSTRSEAAEEAIKQGRKGNYRREEP